MAESILKGDTDRIVKTKKYESSSLHLYEEQYASGLMIIYGKYDVTLSHYNAVYHGYYGYKTSIIFTSYGMDKFVNSNYAIFHMWYIGSGYSHDATSGSGSNGDRCELVGVSSSYGSQACQIHFKLVGFWK